ncbi:MAG: epimerase [Actinobacteria bacterium]|nr:MAG: epimerase [Actinomycetota bacterium]
MKIAVAGATGRVGRHTADVLEERGHEVVRMSRTTGVDVISGEGLEDALLGVQSIVDAATGPSPDQDAATRFFTTSARNLQAAGDRAGVERIVVVSIVATDRYSGGYGVAKVAHEQVLQAGPVPALVLHATQFHEFVEQLMQWGTRDGAVHLPRMQTQLVAARAVGEALADLATGTSNAPMSEIGGPRAERLAEMAALLASRNGGTRIEELPVDPDDPDSVLMAEGGLLPGPDAILAGPTFEEWLSQSR